MRCILCTLYLSGVVFSSASADTDRSDESGLQVELFAAVDAGQIDLKLIPKDSTESTVIIKNNTEALLHITLPEAFAGVPVLAQIGGGGGGGGFGIGGGGGAQGVGGGLGGGGGGRGGGGGGGVFSVGPDSVRKIQVTTVCLEHGKDDPKPKIPYEMQPIESFTQDSSVIELVKMLGNAEIDQEAAQAAVWHLTAGLSWDELLTKVKVEHFNGTKEYYFNRQQIVSAAQVAAEATRRADSRETVTSESNASGHRVSAYDRYRDAGE